jgi:hypothetical protein
MTAMVLVYYGATLRHRDKWAKGDSVFLKSGTRLDTNLKCVEVQSLYLFLHVTAFKRTIVYVRVQTFS